MKIDDTIDKNLQYDINREGSKISASVKIDKNEYLMDEEILPCVQRS